MKRTTFILLLVLFQYTAEAQQRYQLETKKSKILWKVETIGKHNGDLLFTTGNLDYSSKGDPLSAYFIIDMNKIRSIDRPTAAGRNEIDKQLKTPGFFDVGAYPTATMEVKQIIRTTNPANFKVMGNLTIKGISNPIEFIASINKKGDVISVKANLSIARAKWKIDLQANPKEQDFFSALKDKMIADDIQITLDLTFNHSTKQSDGKK